MSALLEIRSLLVRREQQIVVDIDSLTVERGEILGVIGPNGSGKSSLLLALARLLKPARGEIIFAGQSITAEGDTAYRRRLSLVLQEPLLLDMSLFENVAAGLRFRQMPRREIEPRVEEWLSRLGIAHLRQRHASKLSGGEAQRVSLARAFAIQPELLLLDEPFSSLDAPTRSLLYQDIQSVLAETRITTILVTHDLQEAARLCDHLAVMLDSRLEQWGRTADVFAQPVNANVSAFLGYPSKVK